MSTGYRPPSTEPQGRWARHLHAQRKARGWSASRAFEELHEGLRLSPRSRSAYVAIDMGKRPPTASEAEYLASVFGWPPDEPPEPLEATQTPDPVASAIQALADELLAWRTEDRVRLEALELTVGRLVAKHLNGRENSGSPGRSAPPETVG